MAGLNNQVHGELDLRIGCALSGGPGKRRAMSGLPQKADEMTAYALFG
jgi:hypothetical protein